MSKPHPSLSLVMDIDERWDTKEFRQEIDRCYAYLGIPVIRTHAAAEGDPEHTLQMNVRVGARQYLDSSAEGADELWADYVEHWLLNQFHAVDNQMRIFNRRQREEGTPELVFTWLEVSLQGGALAVRLRLDSESGIDPEASRWVSAVRAAYNDGTLGEGAVAVQLPSDASYEAQREAGLAAKAEREAAAAAEAEAAAAAAAAEAEAAEQAAAAAFMESPALLAEAAEAAAVDEEASDLVVQARIRADLEAAERGELDKTPEQIIAERIAEEAHLGEDIERKYALPEADFPIAFDQWTVIYADGTRRDLDATGRVDA
ncbi:MAG: hypothetical protein HFJ75_09595 [Eggerthellaceae bacterium]|nr:hypothetical protein [Eggerthellaceae bacterium]